VIGLDSTAIANHLAVSQLEASKVNTLGAVDCEENNLNWKHILK